MQKKELFKISEAAKMFHISVGTLRHYEKLGLLKPEYTDVNSGYRYYSAQQFECLNTIRYLRALDMPLENIAAFLQNRNIDGIRTLLLDQKEEVIRRQKELAAIAKKIDNRLSQINDALSCTPGIIEIVSMPPRRIALLKETVSPKNYLDLEYSIRRLDNAAKDGIIFLGKVGVGISAERLLKEEFSPYDYVFLLLDDEDSFAGSTTLLPAETCAVIRFQGSHKCAPPYYKKLIQFIKKNNHTICGLSKEITLIDDGLTTDTSKYLTEIQIPIV